MADQDSVKKLIIEEFKNAGYSNAGISGVLGNVQAESKFDPSIVGSNRAYGLFQFDFHKKHYNAFLKQRGLEDSAVSQIKYVIADLKEDLQGLPTLKKGAKSVTSPTELKKINKVLKSDDHSKAAIVFGTDWEKAGTLTNKEKYADRIPIEKQDRMKYAQENFQYISSATLNDVPKSKPGLGSNAEKQTDEALLADKTRSDTLLPEKELDKQTQDILDASAFTDTEINMNEGGMAKNQYDQLEMFADGGLYEEGGMVDDESGNEVPPGSLKEEVRDDIPANLSEGEFVFPADVVRYWGLDTLMRMRQKAKAGLKRMEDMGQMGNADEATMPDDLPFDINDLELEDEQGELNFQTGGLATNPLTQNAMGNFMGSAGTDPNQMYGPMYTPLGYPSTQQTPEASATAPMEAASARYMQPSQYAYQAPSFTYTPEKEVMPTFRETTGMGVPGIDYETLTYVNDAGDTIIMYKDKKTGKLYNDMFQEASVPEGYKLQTEVKPEEVTTKTTKVVDTGGGREQTEEDQEKMKTDRARVDAAKKMGYKNFAGVIEGITAAFGFGTLPEGTVTGTGYVSDGKGQIFDPLTGRPIPSNIQGALKKSWGQITDAIKGKDRFTQDLIAKGLEQSTKFGKEFYRQAGIVKVDRIFDDIKNNIKEGGALDRLGEDYIDAVRNSVKAEAKKGNFYTESGLIANPFEAGRNRGTGGVDDTPSTPSTPTVGVEETGPDWGDSNTGGDRNTGNDTGGYGGTDSGVGSDDGGGGYGDGDSDSGSGTDGSGTDSYICTASYANGLIAHDHFTSLKKYGIMLRRNDPYLMKAYDWFGPALASKVKDGKLAGFAKHTTDMWKYNQTKQSDAPFEIKFMSYFHRAITRPALRILGRCLTVKEKLYK